MTVPRRKRTRAEVSRRAEAIGRSNPRLSIASKFKIANAAISRERRHGKKGKKR